MQAAPTATSGSARGSKRLLERPCPILSFDAQVPDSEVMLAVRQVSLRRLALHILVPATLAASWASLRWLIWEVLLGRAASCGGWGLSHVRGASIGEFHPRLGPPSSLKQQEQLLPFS